MLRLEINIRRRHVYALIAAIALIVTIIPVASFAAHTFDDVPDSNIFHDDIAWLKDADVTKGCNPPANTEFCPDGVVDRQAMAAFMHRLAVNQVVDAKTAIDAENADDADMLDGLDSMSFLPDGTPPVGTTIRGNYALGNDSNYAWDNLQWGFELPSPPTAHVIGLGDTPPAECPGSATDPQADPGHLCVYEAVTSNQNLLHVFKGSTGSSTGVDEYGAGIIGYQSSAGDHYSYGTWALTVGAGGGPLDLNPSPSVP